MKLPPTWIEKPSNHRINRRTTLVQIRLTMVFSGDKG
jgi:hypothetical protein